ncbi:MAG: hypothetical protein ACYS21_16235 [Planctomycetota bacterium]|jgi:hypothetical protein
MKCVRIAIFAAVTSLGTATLLVAVASGGKLVRGEAAPVHVGELRSPDEKRREEAAEVIRKQQEQLVAGLVEIAGQEVPAAAAKGVTESEYAQRHSRYLAIGLLGDLRAREAVSVLTASIQFCGADIMVDGGFLELGEVYPAAGALAKIGMPSIDPTMKKLGMYDEEGLGRKLCCWVINKVLGHRLGKLRVEMAVERARDAKVKKNLESALGYFETDAAKRVKPVWEGRW